MISFRLMPFLKVKDARQVSSHDESERAFSFFGKVDE